MDWLDTMGVSYEEVDARGRDDIATVPVTEIGEMRIVGFDRPAIRKALRNL